MVKVYIAKTEPLKNEELFLAVYKTVHKERQIKADRYMTQQARRLSVAAGALLKKALFDCDITDAQIEYGKNGKPFIKNGGVFFNLSHSEERVMCAISDCEVGCDVEKLRPIEHEIADRFFSTEEKKHLGKFTNEAEKRTEFFRLWTLKESFLKATGQGMALPLSSFSIELGADGIAVRQSYNDKKYYFKEYSFLDEYRYAVCAMTPHIADSVEIIELKSLV